MRLNTIRFKNFIESKMYLNIQYIESGLYILGKGSPSWESSHSVAPYINKVILNKINNMKKQKMFFLANA